MTIVRVNAPARSQNNVALNFSVAFNFHTDCHSDRPSTDYSSYSSPECFRNYNFNAMKFMLLLLKLLSSDGLGLIIN
jgi:hypothetical protein